MGKGTEEADNMADGIFQKRISTLRYMYVRCVQIRS